MMGKAKNSLWFLKLLTMLLQLKLYFDQILLIVRFPFCQ